MKRKDTRNYGKNYAEGGAVFDPEGDDYDYETARSAGMGPDQTGHWSSRDPSSGLILKGRSHPSFDYTIKGEEEAGYEITKKDDGRYYSFPKKK